MKKKRKKIIMKIIIINKIKIHNKLYNKLKIYK